jgi:tRNA 2-thiouridine synthesizing protein A
MSEELSLLKANYIADARNAPCPGPLLTAKSSITKVQVGESLELLASEGGAAEDIPAFAKKSGNEYLGTTQRDGYASYFILRKK